MPKIGRMLKQEDQSYAGGIRTLKYVQPFRLVPVQGARRSEDSPDYTVEARGPDGKPCEIGAAWRKESEKGRKYFSISLTDPDIPEHYQNVAAFPDDVGDLEIVWSRRTGSDPAP